ncbi:hypothetical protein EVAR_11019_1 [Eumeta japonica]|uniref:Uncharacterized protein n=1 Tax=Eumeta variegata TaxID=151549 RepID=A0A4C1YIA4_EUMVA|nr:hypothetical protein EVAR_11019_1 [Eumeta japonica]
MKDEVKDVLRHWEVSSYPVVQIGGQTSIQATKNQMITAAHGHPQPQRNTSVSPAFWVGIGYLMEGKGKNVRGSGVMKGDAQPQKSHQWVGGVLGGNRDIKSKRIELGENVSGKEGVGRRKSYSPGDIQRRIL